MSELTLYGHIVSQPVRSVMAYLKLSNIEFNFELVDFTQGAHLTEEYTKLNPYQTMPLIVHNGYSVWESAAIISYLAETYNQDNQWYPKDIKLRARINAFLHWHHQNIRDPCMNYLRPKVLGPKLYGAPEITEEIEAPIRERFNQMLADIKWTLASTRYIARSANPTIADIFVFNEVGLTLGLFNLEEHPEIKSWYEEIAAIPALKEITDQCFEIVRKILG